MADQRAETTRPDDADELSAGLSDAARGVIHQDADPRLDAHLARMLSGVDDAADGARSRPNGTAHAADLEQARADLELLRSELASARRVVRMLTWLLTIAVATIVALIVVVAVR